MSLKCLIYMYSASFTIYLLMKCFLSLQITLLLHSSFPCDDSLSGVHDQNHMEASTDIFGWLSILWERGFLHDNPHGTSNLP